jgi:uncharacterized protein (DUF1330 family)
LLTFKFAGSGQARSQSLTATELDYCANISRSTASGHLSKLVVPEAYQSKTVRHGTNRSRETIANLAARMRRNLEARMENEMVAYWVARSKVNDPEQYKKYADLAPAIIGKFGGKFLARGGKFKILEGSEKFHRFIVIEFASLERAVACHDSPEYQAAAAHRKKDGAGELELVVVESI